MQKTFLNVDEMIADDTYLSWFYKESDEKVTVWENWLSENQEYRDMAAEATEIMDSFAVRENPVSSFKIEREYAELNAKLEELENDTAPVVRMRSSRRHWWIGAAAAVLILFSGLYFFKFSSVSSKPVIETQYGQLTQQELPDGSQVMLNAHTTVTLSKDWNQGEDREVWLKGEAFFHVKKTAQRNRFIVHAGQLDVIVTGTQFNVSTRDDKTSVLLTEGSVTIKTNDGQEILMKPGDFVEIQNNKAEKKTTNEETVLAWKENKLNFDKTPMKDVVSMIRNHYGVVIRLEDDSVGEKTINGIMPNNNLDVLLQAIEATNDFKIMRNDKTIVIANP